jgi:hypothetical protein
MTSFVQTPPCFRRRLSVDDAVHFRPFNLKEREMVAEKPQQFFQKNLPGRIQKV